MIQRIRIWWWKWRYVEHMLKKLGERDSASIRAAKHCSEEGWRMALEWEGGDVKKALAYSPQEAAQDELYYWTAD